MHFAFQALGWMAAIAGIFCAILMLVQAFADAAWKGALWIATGGIYGIYYSIFEYKRENKWLVVLLAWGGLAAAFLLLRMV